LDAGRFKRFNIPESWTIIDKYSFGKPTKIEGEIDREFERRLWERVDWYKRMGIKVKII
jgi:predicted oxidoreductase (fatty acid repression mutant protein)